MRNIDTYNLDEGEVFGLYSNQTGIDLLIKLEDKKQLYDAMNLAEDIMLHYENGDECFSGMSPCEVLEYELHEKGIDVTVFER